MEKGWSWVLFRMGKMMTVVMMMEKKELPKHCFPPAKKQPYMREQESGLGLNSNPPRNEMPTCELITSVFPKDLSFLINIMGKI